jgi:transposase
MKDTEFFQRALELRDPWQVKEVKMDLEKRKVEVVIECRATAWGDPESGGRAHVHGYEPRQWRHLDTMQFETVLTAKVPRVKYADGRTELVAVPWAQPHGRFTLLFEAWAIQVLFACHSVSAACELLGLNWETAQTIMNRAVERGLARRDLSGLARLGIDEKSFGRGQDYIAVLSDIDRGCVLEVVPGRDQASAELLLETVPEEQRAEIEAVAMDMSGAFAAAVQAQLPDADIVYDRFHVSALLNQAVDEVRRAEHKRLLGEGDESLKGTRQLWLFNPRNLADERLDFLARLAACNFKTSRAWLQKENFEGFWAQESRWNGEGYLHTWYKSAIHCRLEPVKRAARTIKKHAEGLLNYFDHHISNAVAEGLNSRIQAIKSAARGFRNFENYRTRILFFCGKLQLAPAGAP